MSAIKYFAALAAVPILMVTSKIGRLSGKEEYENLIYDQWKGTFSWRGRILHEHHHEALAKVVQEAKDAQA